MSTKQAINPFEVISDWYLPTKNPTNGYIFPGPLDIKAHKDLLLMAQELHQACKEREDNHREDFVITHKKMKFRGHIIQNSVEGEVITLRLIPDVVPPIADLGLEKAVESVLLHDSLSKGGLVIITGETGQGKSTTCAATIAKRLEKFSSFCLTIEDPPELPLHGRHGNGRCIQTEVPSGEFANALKGAMRCYPTSHGNMLYVGETRDPETATELIRIVTNGHLVFTTLHGSDIISSLKRFITLATGKFSEADVKSILASSLRVVLHQRLIDLPAIGSKAASKKLETEFLLSHDASTPVAQRIRNSTNIDGLKSDIEQQRNTLRLKGVDDLMKLWK